MMSKLDCFSFCLLVCQVIGMLPQNAHSPSKRIRRLLSSTRIDTMSNEYRNSTSSSRQIPSSDVIADALGVRRGSHAPRKVWKYSWRIHGYLLPTLHAFDQARSKDLDYSLKCLWCKALSGLDKRSPVFDEGVAYDMLPERTRRFLKLPNRVFPRLIHFNIELRTAFLDQSLRAEIEAHSDKRIRLITLGAGYDTRSIRFLTEDFVQEAWELDVEPVIASKRIMMERLRQRRQTNTAGVKLPKLLIQNLNELVPSKETLSKIIHTPPDDKKAWHTIIMLEGVFIYLDKGIPSALLRQCSTLLRTRNMSGSLIFADLIRNLGSSDREVAELWFQSEGWDLLDWCVKPGLARHMGVARIHGDNYRK